MLGITIGNFDGFHLGHKALIDALKKQCQSIAVVTFSNHPSTVLKNSPTPTIVSLTQKLQLLKKEGVDTILTLPFTKELSCLSAKQFLLQIREKLPFDFLLLGPNARLGHKREAGPPEITALAKEMGFVAEFIPLITQVSSTQIRTLIQQGNLKEASLMLGRPYSISSTIQKGLGVGKLLGFRTLNINLEGLVFPPLGVYIVTLLHQGKTYQGVANLGKAPTVRNSSHPILEVHILDFNDDLYLENVEIFFHRYLREEKTFPSLHDLKEQIAKDIVQTKQFFLI